MSNLNEIRKALLSDQLVKSSEILQLAYEYIWNSRDVFVCCALDSVRGMTLNRKSRRKATEIKLRIRRSINGDMFTAVEHWLVTQGYAKRSELTFEAMKEYRLAWIEELIQGYQSKGD
jgi:aryl carrier-like protein